MMLEARNLSMRRQGRMVLDDASVAIAPGRITGVLGPNGAGKSTLLKALAGLLPHSSGAVHLGGAPLATMDRRALARQIAYLPQERIVHWPLAVRRIVALGRLPHQQSTAAGESPDDTRAIEAAMSAMEIGDLAARPADQLSGGELARVLLARALAQEARIILADEPTAGLDPAHALSFFAVLTRLASEGRGVAVALHDLSAAARFCHDVVILTQGRVAASGLTKDVLTPEQLSRAYGVRMLVGQLDDLPIVLPVAPL